MIFTSFPKVSFLKNKKKILNKIDSIITKGNYINSNEVKTFEKNFSKYIGCKYAVSVGNATDAIFLSLQSLNIGYQDEVVTVSHTATATITAIMRTNAKPIFVDINEKDFNFKIDDLEKKISSKTKAIIIVHLYGQSCDMQKLLYISKKHKIPLIEDCSQSAGAYYKNKRLGSFGLMSCFSFFPTKNLSTLGDGGCVVSNNKKLINKIISLREYGWDKFRNSRYTGINSRLDEIHAGILNINLKKLDNYNKERRIIAKTYDLKLKNKLIKLPKENDFNFHVYHHYVIRVKNRNKFLNYMSSKGFALGIHYKKPVHKQKILIHKKFHLPITEKIASEIVSLPIYVGLKRITQKKIINAINLFQV